VLSLDLSDLLHLLARDLADFVLVRGIRTLLNTCRALDQECRRRTLEDELEGTIGEDGDFRRDNLPDPVSGAGIVILAERHQVDAVLRQCRADWGSRIGFARVNRQRNDCFDFLCHFLFYPYPCMMRRPVGRALKRCTNRAGSMPAPPSQNWLEPLGFFDLQKVQFDRRLAPTEPDHDADFRLLDVDVAYRADELVEWPINDTHALPRFERHLDLGRFFFHAPHNLVDFFRP